MLASLRAAIAASFALALLAATPLAAGPYNPVVQAAQSKVAAAGFDPQALLALTNEAQTKQALKDATEEAVRRGVFGAPTFFVGEQMFWGQDRIDFLKEALQ